jgi:L-threonylcarbamoyladenylate synthase
VALRRIFALKGRPVGKPLPVLLSAAAGLARVATNVDDRVVVLLDRFWPGPLTVVVPARAGMPPEVLGPDQTIGARVPNHFLALELIERAGGAVAATSANRSDEAPAVTGGEVAELFGDAIDVVLDGGIAPGGVPSTVIAFDGDGIAVLREGAIPGEVLHASWREIVAG